MFFRTVSAIAAAALTALTLVAATPVHAAERGTVATAVASLR